MFDFSGKRPFDVPIVVVDTETTGLHPGLGDRVVELGAVRLENGKTVAQMSQLLSPNFPMSATSTKISNICDADLVGQPAFADILPDFLRLIDGALLVAHNAQFDARFLSMELLLAQGDSPRHQQKERPLPNPWLCTFQLARRMIHFGSNSLKNIAHTLGVRVGRTHRALNDVFMTIGVLQGMVRELQKQRYELLDDLLYLQGEPIFTPPPPDVYLPDLVLGAMENGRLLQVQYRGKRKPQTITIQPHYPTQHEGVPYLIATNVEEKRRFPYRLDQISQVVTVS